jgi:hypothetical protein
LRCGTGWAVERTHRRPVALKDGERVINVVGTVTGAGMASSASGTKVPPQWQNSEGARIG